MKGLLFTAALAAAALAGHGDFTMRALGTSPQGLSPQEMSAEGASAAAGFRAGRRIRPVAEA